LTVAAPGLPEAEVTPDGVIVITLVRAVGCHAPICARARSSPTDGDLQARIRVGFPIGGVSGVRLDESPWEFPLQWAGGEVQLLVPAHALRSLLLLPPRRRVRAAGAQPARRLRPGDS